MFYIYFFTFFVILFSIFFLCPSSSSRNSQTNNQNQQSQQQQQKSENQSKNSNSLVKTNNKYSQVTQKLQDLSKEKQLKVNNSKKPKLSISLNKLVKSVEDVQQVEQQLQILQFKYDIFVFYYYEEQELNEKEFSLYIQKLKDLIGKVRVMDGKSQQGISSMIRQLNSRIHLEGDISIINQLKPHLHRIATFQTDETIKKDLSQSQNVVLRSSVLNLFQYTQECNF